MTLVAYTLADSIALVPTVMINIVSSIILIPPPYNFSIGALGLINIPGLMGQFVGAVGGGYLADMYSNRISCKHNGVFEPEMRLVLIDFPELMVFADILLFGSQRRMSCAGLPCSLGMGWYRLG
jgi:hypothetical protein